MDIERKRISGDLVYNYLSVGITAICGAAFSIIISFFYPEEMLGRFNTIYSYYIVLSQFCVWGIHMAIVKYAAEEEGISKALLSRVLVLTIAISVFVSINACFVVNMCLKHLIGDSMVQSFNTIWVALVFFSINKVFLGWLNGKSLMRAFAIFQATRNFTIAISLIIFSVVGISGTKLTYCFAMAEILLCLCEIFYCLKKRNEFNNKPTSVKLGDILWFGTRILPSNAVMELNTKIDVICLSIITNNEALVGVYSFAAMFGEGFYQLFVVVRKIMNPHLTKKNEAHKLDQYINFIKVKYTKWLYIGSALCGLLLLFGFNFLISLIGKDGYEIGAIVLAVLCLFMVLNAKSIVFGNILAQTGNPSEESFVNIITATCNGVLNIFMIFCFGIYGAALATGISYCVYTIFQRYFVTKKLKVRM